MSFESAMPPYNSQDPTASFLNVSCLDFLLIELVPLAYRITNELEPPTGSAVLQAGDTSSTSQNGATGATAASAASGALGVGTLVSSTAGSARRMDEEEERDAVFHKLEELGYRVGQGLVERFSRGRPRLTEPLDMIKFVCKDLWSLVFRKQVDNLKTNHRGVYVLTDNNFRPLTRMSTDAGGQAVLRAKAFLQFPCGIIQGALAALGISSTVQADSSDLPSAVFQIRTMPQKA